MLGQMMGKEGGISNEQINILNEAADVSPLCLGSCASRATLFTP
jgi:hypothetical protein